MKRASWWLVDRVTGALPPDEREAVCGDLIESRVTGGRALRDVLGLVARRQVTYWQEWRPWLTFLGFVVPVSILLSIGSSGLGRSYGLYLWVFQNYRDIDPTVGAETGLTVRQGIVILASRSFVLACWSWASGFALGSLSRRTRGVNGCLLCCAVLVAGFPNWYTGGPLPSVTVLNVLRPVVLLVLLTLLPLLWGMHQGGQRLTSTRVEGIAWVTALVTALTVNSVFWWPFRDTWQMQLILLAVYVPLGYLVSTSWRRWRDQSVSS